jgi:hypothetical protein
VTLQADRSNIVSDRISLTVQARTYFGAPLPGAPLTLNRLTRSYNEWWYGAEAFDAWSTLQAEEPLGRTGADGRWSGWIDLQVPDYVFRDYYYSRHAVPVLLEVMVSDGNGQAIGAQARVTVHDAALDVSGGLDRYMYEPGETITVKAMTRDIDGQPRAGEPVTAKVLQWTGNGYNQVMAQANAVSDQTAVELALAAPVRLVSCRDYGRAASGQAVTVTDWLWVYDPRLTCRGIAKFARRANHTDKDRHVSVRRRGADRSPIGVVADRGTGRVATAQVVAATPTAHWLLIQDDDAPNIT